jgi:hypothetical protein
VPKIAAATKRVAAVAQYRRRGFATRTLYDLTTSFIDWLLQILESRGKSSSAKAASRFGDSDRYRNHERPKDQAAQDKTGLRRVVASSRRRGHPSGLILRPRTHGPTDEGFDCQRRAKIDPRSGPPATLGGHSARGATSSIADGCSGVVLTGHPPEVAAFQAVAVAF